MSLTTFRITVSLATVLASIAMFTIFAGAPYVGSAYQMLIESAGSDLPALTGSFSLPLLRPHATDPFSEVGSAAWVWALWTVLLGCLPATLVWTLRAPSLEDAVARWTAGVSVSVCLVLVVAVFTVAGLLMPWFPL